MAKIFMLAIFVIVLAFQSALTMVDEDEINFSSKYTTDELVGNWYLVAKITINSYPEPVECNTLTIKKTDNRNYVKTISSTLGDTFPYEYQWIMQIDNNKLFHHHYVNNTQLKPDIYSFDIFTTKEFFIIYNMTEWQTYRIYSRHRSVARKELVHYVFIAKKNHWKFHYVNDTTCYQRFIEQHKFDNDDVTNFLGRWYMKHMICPLRLSNDHSLVYMDVVDTYDHQLEINTTKKNGLWTDSYQWHGRVYKSHMFEVNELILTPPSFYMTFYKDNAELFLHYVDNIHCDSIWKRNISGKDWSLMNYHFLAQERGWNLDNIQIDTFTSEDI
ncbi:hypothetical protein PV328_007493 [Microctonus aethiopoides]|uniref:Uncharacterized protein n=1 Tax=Microctonus aethiopoides TaxID=144406 RepID=A0AA39F1H2_9HYME|nr:hypothetical protein PV328_007493 [Microctonus aethiopoides]